MEMGSSTGSPKAAMQTNNERIQVEESNVIRHPLVSSSQSHVDSLVSRFMDTFQSSDAADATNTASLQYNDESSGFNVLAQRTLLPRSQSASPAPPLDALHKHTAIHALPSIELFRYERTVKSNAPDILFYFHISAFHNGNEEVPSCERKRTLEDCNTLHHFLSRSFPFMILPPLMAALEQASSPFDKFSQFTRKLFQSTQVNAEQEEQDRVAGQVVKRWLAGLLRHPLLMNSGALRHFITQDAPMTAWTFSAQPSRSSTPITLPVTMGAAVDVAVVATQRLLAAVEETDAFFIRQRQKCDTWLETIQQLQLSLAALEKSELQLAESYLQMAQILHRISLLDPPTPSKRFITASASLVHHYAMILRSDWIERCTPLGDWSDYHFCAIKAMDNTLQQRSRSLVDYDAACRATHRGRARQASPHDLNSLESREQMARSAVRDWTGSLTDQCPILDRWRCDDLNETLSQYEKATSASYTAVVTCLEAAILVLDKEMGR